MNSLIINFISPFTEVYYSPNWSDPLVLVTCLNLPELLPGYSFRKRSSSHSVFQPRTVKLPNNTTYYSCLLMFDGCVQPLQNWSLLNVILFIQFSVKFFPPRLVLVTHYCFALVRTANRIVDSGYSLKTLFFLVIPCMSSHTLSLYYSICICIWNTDARLWS